MHVFVLVSVPLNENQTQFKGNWSAVLWLKQGHWLSWPDFLGQSSRTRLQTFCLQPWTTEFTVVPNVELKVRSADKLLLFLKCLFHTACRGCRADSSSFKNRSLLFFCRGPVQVNPVLWVRQSFTLQIRMSDVNKGFQHLWLLGKKLWSSVSC